MLQHPMILKLLVLLVTRLMLLAGVLLAWGKASTLVRLGLIVGTVALTLSGAAACLLVTSTGSLASIPCIWTLTQVLEVGGWIFFSAGFVGLALTQHKTFIEQSLDAVP